MDVRSTSNVNRTNSPRRRALSDAIPNLTPGRWRIVGAWSSLRRSLDPKRPIEANSIPSRASSPLPEGPATPDTTTSRKRISLFLRRRRDGERDSSRRIQSRIISPEPSVDPQSPAFLDYASDSQENSAVVSNTSASSRNRRAGFRLVTDDDANDAPDADGEIIGEICLEDFADGEDDFDLLDGQSLDLGYEGSSFGRMSRRPSLKLDNKLRWIGDEKEFAAFFAEVGLDELFDVEEQQWQEFEVDDDVENEWRAAGEEHNERCSTWETMYDAPDIRDLLVDYREAMRRRRPQTGLAH